MAVAPTVTISAQVAGIPPSATNILRDSRIGLERKVVIFLVLLFLFFIPAVPLNRSSLARWKENFFLHIFQKSAVDTAVA